LKARDLLLAVMYAFGGRAPSVLHLKAAMFIVEKHRKMRFRA
jgi:hypothetical protein